MARLTHLCALLGALAPALGFLPAAGPAATPSARLAGLGCRAAAGAPRLRRLGLARLAADGKPPLDPAPSGALATVPALLSQNTELRTENAELRDENARLRLAQDNAAAELLQIENLARLARRSLLDNLAVVNLVIITTFGIGLAYSLLGTDLRAIFALYYFDLGPDVYPGFARSVVALDLFVKLPGELLHQYEALVPTNPVFYKACTSGVAYTFGDFISQIYQGRDLKTLDLPRSVRSGLAGFIGHGPLCHYWMLTMENYLDFGGAWWGTGVKVLADQTVWSLYLNAMYSFLIGTLALRNPKDVWQDVKSTSWPALRSSWRFWPFVHCISFSHAVPLDLKLLWVDVMEIVWVTILSQVANQDGKDVADEQDTVVSQAFGVDPALEMILSQEVMSGELMYAAAEGGGGAPGWKCSEDGECWLFEGTTTVGGGADGADGGGGGNPFAGLTLPTAQQLASNCWPLGVMWPVLYAFHQAELALGFNV